MGKKRKKKLSSFPKRPEGADTGGGDSGAANKIVAKASDGVEADGGRFIIELVLKVLWQ